MKISANKQLIGVSAFALITMALFAWYTSISEQETEIVPVARVNPTYPSAAVEQNLEGDVVLRFDIKPDGTTSNISVINSVHIGVFDEAAITAMSQWVYTPPKDYIQGVEVALTFALN